MAVYSTIPLSGSTNGRPIPIAGTANPGTTIHTVSTATGQKEYPYIYAWNLTTATMYLTVAFGGTATTNEFIVRIPGQEGLHGITAGMMLVGATGMTISAWATATAGLAVGGYVDKVT